MYATVNIAASWFGDFYSCKCGEVVKNYKPKLSRRRQHTLKYFKSDSSCVALLLSHIILRRVVNWMYVTISLRFLSLPKIILGRSLLWLCSSYILHEIPYTSSSCASNKTFPCAEASLTDEERRTLGVLIIKQGPLEAGGSQESTEACFRIQKTIRALIIIKDS